MTTDAPWIIPPLLRRACAAVGARLGAAFEETQPRIPTIAGDDVLHAGQALGYHEVARHFASGERCELYLVVDTIRSRERIARVPRRAALRRDPGLAAALRASAELLLNHQSAHLAVVIAHGMSDEAEPRPYRITERLVGRNLGAYLRRRGRLEVALVLEIGAQVADALAALHRIGLTGADLHPGAVMLSHVAGDHFTITLTGLDRVRRITAGSSDVPEELRRFGALLYHLIAGGPPSTSGTDGALSLAAAGCEVPAALEELVRRLTARGQAVHPSLGEAQEALRSIGRVMGRSPYASMLGPRMPPGGDRAPRPVRPAKRPRPGRSVGEQSLVMIGERSSSPLALARLPRWFLLCVGVVMAMSVLVLVLVLGGRGRLAGGEGGPETCEALQLPDEDAVEAIRRPLPVIPAVVSEPQAPALARAEALGSEPRPARRRVAPVRVVSAAIPAAPEEAVEAVEEAAPARGETALLSPELGGEADADAGPGAAVDADAGGLLPMPRRSEAPATTPLLRVLEGGSPG